MDRPAEMLLRYRLVSPVLLASAPAPEMAGPSYDVPATHTPSMDEGVLALEADLLQLGHLLTGPLRNRLSELNPDELANAGRHLVHGLLAQIGGHVGHVPLFRGFPRTIPADTFDFYIRRLFTILLQKPEQPCVLCGHIKTVHPVSPCAHLVCQACWDGSDFSACPICHRRIDLDDPFLRPADNTYAKAAAKNSTNLRASDHFTLLGLCDDPAEWARDLLTTILSRQAAPRAEDRTAVADLIDSFWPLSADWLPAVIPARETRAVVLATAVRLGMLDKIPALDGLDRLDGQGGVDVRDLLGRHIGSATDVLRLLYVLMGGDPGLRERLPRRTTLARPLRRVLLAALDRLALPHLIEDVHRYGEVWKHLAEVLHPHEFHRRYPDAALAFATLRGSRLDTGTPMARALLERAAAYPDVLRFDGVRLHARTFAGRVEAALRSDPAQALDLLAHRPGELIRRTVDLTRRVPADQLAAALAEAASRVSPAVLISTLGQLRTPPGGTRMFLPRGGSARIWVEPDAREPLPAATATAVSAVLIAELLRRAGTLPSIEQALLDEELADLLAPTAERSASSSLVRLPRGSVRPIPGGDRIRLFLHWAESKGESVDLDLSVALFDERWQFTGLCDYTDLRFGENAAVHSGDLTSAPEPLGASEFIDLDIAALRTAGGRYAVPIVFSYTGTPFNQLVRGFAGFMETPDGLFDPLAVRQRFDLSGPAKILIPLVADLWSRTMRWTDLNLSAFGAFHNVNGYKEQIGRLGSALEDVYGLGERVTMWEVACWHAAARAQEIVVRHRDGTTSRHFRGSDDAAAFAARLTTPSGDRGTVMADFAALIQDDAQVTEGAQVYVLHPERLDPTKVRLLDATDLISQLA